MTEAPEGYAAEQTRNAYDNIGGWMGCVRRERMAIEVLQTKVGAV